MAFYCHSAVLTSLSLVVVSGHVNFSWVSIFMCMCRTHQFTQIRDNKWTNTCINHIFALKKSPSELKINDEWSNFITMMAFLWLNIRIFFISVPGNTQDVVIVPWMC